MHVKMSYGRHGLELSLPEAWSVTVIRKIAASLDHDKRVAVIPEGPYILSFLQTRSREPRDGR